MEKFSTDRGNGLRALAPLRRENCFSAQIFGVHGEQGESWCRLRPLPSRVRIALARVKQCGVRYAGDVGGSSPRTLPGRGCTRSPRCCPDAQPRTSLRCAAPRGAPRGRRGSSAWRRLNCRGGWLKGPRLIACRLCRAGWTRCRMGWGGEPVGRLQRKRLVVGSFAGE